MAVDRVSEKWFGHELSLKMLRSLHTAADAPEPGVAILDSDSQLLAASQPAVDLRQLFGDPLYAAVRTGTAPASQARQKLAQWRVYSSMHQSICRCDSAVVQLSRTTRNAVSL